ncbi:transposase [Patescibacteria group bacterium]|nr:transposase [Patescibacteria group bacterium]
MINDKIQRKTTKTKILKTLPSSRKFNIKNQPGWGISSFGKLAVIQRCQWHKRENIVSYLPKSEQKWMRKRLQQAYNRPTYNEASKALSKIEKELSERNQSAEGSLQEGLEETLTLHKLGVFSIIGTSFKTTNCIESINSQAEEICGKVDHWKNSNQRQRWLAAALTDIEGRLYRVRGRQHLGKLREALMTHIFGENQERRQKEIAA